MSIQKPTTKKRNLSDSFFDAVLECIFASYFIFCEAVKTDNWKKKENILLILSFFLATSAIIYRDHHLLIIKEFTFEIFHQAIDRFSTNFGLTAELVLNGIFTILLGFFLIGLGPYRIKRKYQKGIDRLRLKSGLEERPKVLDVQNLNENRTKLLVKSHGLGQDRYKTKLDDLRASVGQRVESVKYLEKNNSFIEIYLARRPLETLVKYDDVIGKLSRPYSFVVGKSLGGLVTQSIADDAMPHLMIGGTTGGGKSVTFNNVLLNLLESSDNLQMYLVDLKGGLEIKAYEGIENVELIKNIQDSTILLKKLVDEMEFRYKYLEENNHKKIDPKRDKMNRIVIAIDECTDLLGHVPRTHPDYSYISKAIEYCDALARKARACGIHIILATQKIDKSSIPTRIQENMSGRLAMRVKTMENSIRLLGNRKAYDLPAIAGRAIWSKDSDFTEVQIPFISDEEIVKKIGKIKENLGNGSRVNFKINLRKQKQKEDLRTEKSEFVEKINAEDTQEEND
ncbi:MAG: hypothetical protein ACJAS4_003064 [Bacteriovoracaceae bacterium]|jgi:hypothetical protein